MTKWFTGECNETLKDQIKPILHTVFQIIEEGTTPQHMLGGQYHLDTKTRQ